VVTHQLQVERRTSKERWPETDVLPLANIEVGPIAVEPLDTSAFISLLVEHNQFSRRYDSKVKILHKIHNYLIITDNV